MEPIYPDIDKLDTLPPSPEGIYLPYASATADIGIEKMLNMTTVRFYIKLIKCEIERALDRHLNYACVKFRIPSNSDEYKYIIKGLHEHNYKTIDVFNEEDLKLKDDNGDTMMIVW